MVNVEEDYQVCVRMLARSAAAIHRGHEGTSARAHGRA